MQILATYRVGLLVLAGCLVAMPGLADVVVVVNRSPQPVSFRTATSDQVSRDFMLASGELITIPMRSTITLSCAAAQPTDYELYANEAYYFKLSADRTLVLEQIDLGGDPDTRAGRDLGKAMGEAKDHIIPVKILVDDDEPAKRELWEARIRKRLDAASEIFASLFRVRFQVVAAGTWQSSNEATTLDALLQEFERSTPPQPAQLAIGFTSQVGPRDNVQLPEVLPPPLHSHLLVCERSARLSEYEKTELLVHALGHYLGALHSPEPSSVMRIGLGDGQARRRDYQIAFDPVNALAVYLVAEEVRFRSVAGLADLSPSTTRRLRQLLTTFDQFSPGDPLALRNLELLKVDRPAAPAPAILREARKSSANLFVERTVTPIIVADARAMVRRIRSTASTNAQSTRPKGGDELTALYVRAAAEARDVVVLESEALSRAFLLAIGIGLDDSQILRNNPLVSDVCRSIESADERAERVRVLGSPTMRGRRDLAQHFAVSAFLTGAFGTEAAAAAGIAKELLDARGGSGFSFADLAADQAGIVWATHLIARRLTLNDVAANFAVADYMPPIHALPEGLDWDTFVLRFGSLTDPRYLQLQNEIQRRIDQLPGYHRLSPRP